MGVFIVTNLFLLFPLLAIVVYFEKRVFSKEEVSFSLSLADFVTLFVFIIWVAVGYLASMSKEGAISLLVLSNVVAFTFMWGWYYLQRQLHQCTCMQIEPTCISFSKFKINIWNCGVFVLMLVNALVNALTTDEDHTQKYPYLLTFDNVLAIQFLILIWKTVIIPITHTTPPKELASTGTTNFIAFLSMSLLATYYTTEDISLYLRYVICQKSNTSSFWFAFLLVGQLVVNTVLLTSVLVVVGVLLYTKLRIQTNEKTAILEKNCQEEHNEEHQNVIIAWISSYYATIFFRDVAQNLATIVVYIIAYMVVVCTSSNPCLDATKLPTYTFVAANAVGHIFILVWSLNSFSLKHKISSLSDGMYKTWDLVMWFSLYLAGFFFIVAAVPMVFNSYTSNDTTSFWSGVFESVLLFQEMQLVAEVKATLSRCSIIYYNNKVPFSLNLT
jgi:hypothetical protein